MVKNSFELEVVHSFNSFFTENRKLGFAYRLKQSTFNTQYVDILVDSPDKNYYLAVECKSLAGDKLYFTSNFHKDKNGVHQIDSISGFVK
ncbi:MAG TPA: Holliday junction resolvase, partial [Methanocorpusculum sp.]|nr:Holliday junction resolvase [Methanocorpusculum sp.]